MYRLLTIFTLLAAALLCGTYGPGLAYPGFMTPRASHGVFSGVYGDGWVVDGATMEFPRLAERGNRLDLSFNPWRPGGAPPAVLRATVCGVVASQFEVHTPTPAQIFLSGECEPRRVQLQVLNPVSGSAQDTRALGAQLLNARISSRLGVPIMRGEEITFYAAAFFLLLALLTVAAPQALRLFVAPVSLVCAVTACDVLGERGFGALFGFWLLGVTLCAGALLARTGRSGAGARGAGENRQTASPPLSMRTEHFLAAGAVLVGALLRIYGIDFGYPRLFHPDEVPKMNAIMRMLDAGDLNPRYFLHPSVLLYATYAMNTLLHWLGAVEPFRETIPLAGRTVSCIAGISSIYFTYLLGRRLFSPLAGVVGACILAVAPLHVTCSRYTKEDVLLLFFLLAAVLFLVRAVQDEKPWLLLVAGVLGGLAASTKYSGLVVVGAIAVAPWLKSRSVSPSWAFLPWTAAGIGCVAIGFFGGSPYILLDFKKFLEDFGAERSHMLRGHNASIDAWSELWTYHYRKSFPVALTWSTTILASVAFGALLYTRRVEGWFVVTCCLLFYLPAEWVKAKPPPQPERYIVPCLPFLALAVGALVSDLRARGRQIVALCIAVVAVVAPLIRTTELASEIRSDTRDLMSRWLSANIPPGSHLCFDWAPYNPAFPERLFKLTYLPRETLLQELQISSLRARGCDYIGLSSLYYDRFFTKPNLPPIVRQPFRSIFRELPLVAQIRPLFGTYGFHNPTLSVFSVSAVESVGEGSGAARAPYSVDTFGRARPPFMLGNRVEQSIESSPRLDSAEGVEVGDDEGQ